MLSVILVAIGTLALLVGGYVAINALLARRVERDDFADHTDPVPSTHLVPDNETPVGDTPEAHDEINPHDIPKGSPGRREAERLADGEGGTTKGNV